MLVGLNVAFWRVCGRRIVLVVCGNQGTDWDSEKLFFAVRFTACFVQS